MRIPELRREAAAREAEREKARAASPFFGPRRPRWLGPLSARQPPPPWLDGSLPGDYGWDPLALGRDPARLERYIELELLHARWVVLAGGWQGGGPARAAGWQGADGGGARAAAAGPRQPRTAPHCTAHPQLGHAGRAGRAAARGAAAGRRRLLPGAALVGSGPRQAAQRGRPELPGRAGPSRGGRAGHRSHRGLPGAAHAWAG